MKQAGKRKQASRLPQTIVIEFVPKDEIRVADEVLDQISPSERTAFLIEHGYPIMIVESDPSGKETGKTAYNMENRAPLPEYALESIARYVYEAMQRDLSTPEGKAKFEEWKKQQAEKKNQ